MLSVAASDTVYEVTEHVVFLNEALETEIDCPPTGENRISIQANRGGELKPAPQERSSFWDNYCVPSLPWDSRGQRSDEIGGR